MPNKPSRPKRSALWAWPLSVDLTWYPAPLTDRLLQTPVQDSETVHLDRQASLQPWRLAQASAGRQAEVLVLDCKARQLVSVAQVLLVVEDLPVSLPASLLLDLLLRASAVLLVALPVSLLPLVAAASLRGDE